MDLKEFSRINRERCESPQGFNQALDSWSTSDWFTATMGELGEAANVAKKLNRVRDGVPGNSETPEELRAKLGRELADTFIYLDLLAQSVGVDLSDVVAETFDAKSQKIGYSPRIVTEINQECTKQLLVDCGFTEKEVQVTEQLAAKLELNITQVLRHALRLYEARDAGFVDCKRKDEPVGCPSFE